MKFEKSYTENFLENFQKKSRVSNFTRGTINQKEGTRRPPGAKRADPMRPDSLAAWGMLVGPTWGDR
jgi:hypothetical protein